MSRLCFNKCITKPGASLDSTEQVILLNNTFQITCNLKNIYKRFVLEMCFNVYGSLHGDSEFGVKIIW